MSKEKWFCLETGCDEALLQGQWMSFVKLLSDCQEDCRHLEALAFDEVVSAIRKVNRRLKKNPLKCNHNHPGLLLRCHYQGVLTMNCQRTKICDTDKSSNDRISLQKTRSYSVRPYLHSRSIKYFQQKWTG